jgi:alanine racemase|tara:strand:+ start:2936 stop:3979 length:1044 start_codon:yes stop_codon:yes gene_type:complete
MATATATIDLNAIRQNWQKLRSMSSNDAAAVVKANAYGLGLAQVTKALYAEGARIFFVATVEEGAELRSILGKKPDIYVFSGHMVGDTELIKNYNLIPLINSIEQLSRHSKLLREKKFGVQLDTGMNRLGMEPMEWESVKELALSLNPVLIMSHLACADDPNHKMNSKQLDIFLTLTNKININKSLAATGGILLGPEYHFDLTRPGIGIYGCAPMQDCLPVLKIDIPVIQIRNIESGETVGYGNTWTSPCKKKIATISAGYADGLFRAIGKKAKLYFEEISCPIVGRISMDLIGVDITSLKVDPVRLELINSQQTVDNIAEGAETIGYEFLTSLGNRYSRNYTGVTK